MQPHPPFPHQYLPMNFLRHGNYIIIRISSEATCVFSVSSSRSLAALVPGQVQNLRSTSDTNTPSLTLTWDKPSNVQAAEDVTAYDIHFRPAGIWWIQDYIYTYDERTVDSPATSVLLTGLNPLTTYDFEVRARNAGQDGEWNKFSEYIGMFIHQQCFSDDEIQTGE